MYQSNHCQHTVRFGPYQNTIENPTNERRKKDEEEKKRNAGEATTKGIINGETLTGRSDCIATCGKGKINQLRGSRTGKQAISLEKPREGETKS